MEPSQNGPRVAEALGGSEPSSVHQWQTRPGSETNPSLRFKVIKPHTIKLSGGLMNWFARSVSENRTIACEDRERMRARSDVLRPSFDAVPMRRPCSAGARRPSPAARAGGAPCSAHRRGGDRRACAKAALPPRGCLADAPHTRGLAVLARRREGRVRVLLLRLPAVLCQCRRSAISRN